jgi:hypothetical protein
MKYAKLLLMVIIASGCLLQPSSPTENIIIYQDLTLDEFLDLNGFSLLEASETTDRNKNGQDDLFVWDLDSDGKVDVLIDINEEVREGLHGTTLGFNKILIYDYMENVVWLADVGKSSGKIITVRKVDI